MRTLVYLWLITAVVFIVLYLRRPTKKSGLVLAYIIALVINYWIGAWIYTLPKFHPSNDPRFTYLGLQQTYYALLAFIVGSVVALHLFAKPPATHSDAPRKLTSSRAAIWYLVIGATSYILLGGALAALPSATSLAASGQQLFVVGLCLLLYRSWQEGKRARFLFFLSLSSLLPFVTILAHGFLGYGAIALFSILAFIGTFVRPRAAVLTAGALVGFLSLSLFVTYIRDRTELRAKIWGGAPPSSRIAELAATLSRFEIFSPNNPSHLAAVDLRLNLARFTGVAVHRLEFNGAFAHGKTLIQAAEALIPRALWPGKPDLVGSSNVVTTYTGIQFDRFTSVGAGPVMELYINFGTAGVVIGFLIVGAAASLLDERAGHRLAIGDEVSFATYFVVGLSLLQTGGSFVDVASTAGGAVVLMAIIKRTVTPPAPVEADVAALALTPT